MADKKSEILLHKLLRNLGFNVRRIARSNEERRPDFIASKGQEIYVIEEKSKEILRLFEQAKTQANECGLGYASELVEPSNTLSGIIQKAKGQLAHAKPEHAFRILWFSCLHNRAEHAFELMRRTLYGLASVNVWSDTEADLLRVAFPCYYYHRNKFFDCPWLDAAVLWSGKRWALCVNEFSKRVETLRETSLYRLFVETGGLQDPELLEKENRAFVIRGHVDRRNEQAKGEYLRKKYRCRTSIVMSSAFAGFINVTQTNKKRKPKEQGDNRDPL